MTDRQDKNAPDIVEIVNAQALDEALWCVDATAAEAYLQVELRRLHTAIEGAGTVAAEPAESQVRLAREAIGFVLREFGHPDPWPTGDIEDISRTLARDILGYAAPPEPDTNEIISIETTGVLCSKHGPVPHVKTCPKCVAPEPEPQDGEWEVEVKPYLNAGGPRVRIAPTGNADLALYSFHLREESAERLAAALRTRLASTGSEPAKELVDWVHGILADHENFVVCGDVHTQRGLTFTRLAIAFNKSEPRGEDREAVAEWLARFSEASADIGPIPWKHLPEDFKKKFRGHADAIILLLRSPQENT